MMRLIYYGQHRYFTTALCRDSVPVHINHSSHYKTQCNKSPAFKANIIQGTYCTGQSFITLRLGSIELDHVINEPCCKGIL